MSVGIVRAHRLAYVTGYGLGWTLGQWAGQRTAAHSGGQPGATTFLLLVPARGCAVVVLANRGAVIGLPDLARSLAGTACE